MNETQNYIIYDIRVIEAIRRNGFTCELYQEKIIPGSINFYTKRKQDTNLYTTNCPIAFNGEYQLRDGTCIRSDGTVLILA